MPITPLAERLRAARDESGRTQLAVAVEAELDPSQYSRIERGVTVPTFPTLFKLAVALDLCDLRDALAPLVGDGVPQEHEDLFALDGESG